MLLDVSALKLRPAHFRAILKRESKVSAMEIVDAIMFRSSMKALISGKDKLFR